MHWCYDCRMHAEVEGQGTQSPGPAAYAANQVELAQVRQAGHRCLQHHVVGMGGQVTVWPVNIMCLVIGMDGQVHCATSYYLVQNRYLGCLYE